VHEYVSESISTQEAELFCSC